MLEEYIRKRLKKKKILLMTHIVMGYPSLPESMELVATMVEAGVDLMELQIPFSEPIADGPVILKANQAALSGRTTVAQCLDFAGSVSKQFDIPFLIMTYNNPIFKYGPEAFTKALAKRRIRGTIVADLPPEEASQYCELMQARGLAPVFIFAPTTTDTRMQYIASHSRGMVYCMARKGVTGRQTDFSTSLNRYLGRCRKATSLPLAVGFGVSSKKDVDFLTGKAEIAVIGTKTIQILETKGLTAVKNFLAKLAGS